jgi:GTPase
MQLPTHFRVDEVYTNQNVGNIVAGMLIKYFFVCKEELYKNVLNSKRGTIQENEKLLLGPFESGDFIPVQVKSVHRHRVPCRIVKSGQSAAISLCRTTDKLGEKLRRV